MNKKQKIWFAVFLAMFAVPEVLWSPIANFYYELFQQGDVHPLRDNFFTNYDNLDCLRLILFLQFTGALAMLLIMLKSKSGKFNKIVLSVLLLILTAVSGFVVLFVSYNNPQIG